MPQNRAMSSHLKYRELANFCLEGEMRLGLRKAIACIMS